MPVTITPDPLTKGSGKCRDRVESSPSRLLQSVSPSDSDHPILRSSFTCPDGHDNGPSSSIVPDKNGFTHTVIRAWQQDLHLKLRPDDVWLAILAQFTFFVNANAESLRSIFVPHQDKLELVFDTRPDTIQTADIGAVAQQLASMVQQKLKDPDIATTLLPEFTTTTPHDRATAAIVFLGTMKEYFEYKIHFGCSFPSVTLLGERSDWADMLERVAWIGNTIRHKEAIGWALRLTRVLEYMVASFDWPENADVRQFWTRAVHETGAIRSGGVKTLSGWLTAFCWWDAEGKRLMDYSGGEGAQRHRRLVLCSVEFPIIDREKIPAGVVRVPLMAHQDMREVKTILLAGSMGMQVLIEEDDETAVQPASGWWMLLGD